jgi:hypothetical protein
MAVLFLPASADEKGKMVKVIGLRGGTLKKGMQKGRQLMNP